MWWPLAGTSEVTYAERPLMHQSPYKKDAALRLSSCHLWSSCPGFLQEHDPKLVCIAASRNWDKEESQSSSTDLPVSIDAMGYPTRIR